MVKIVNTRSLYSNKQKANLFFLSFTEHLYKLFIFTSMARIETWKTFAILQTIFIALVSNVHCIECDLDQHECGCASCCQPGDDCFEGCPNIQCFAYQPVCCNNILTSSSGFPVCKVDQHLCECGICCQPGKSCSKNGCPNLACARRQLVCCNNIPTACSGSS